MIWLLVDSSSVGGIERHVATLAQALTAHGEPTEVVLFADHGANPWLQQLQDGRVRYRILDGSARGLWSALRRSRPRLVHTHGYKANILGRLAARAVGIPVVSTFHAGERGAFPVSLYQSIDEYSAVLGENLCVSEEIKRRLPVSATLIENFIAVSEQVPVNPLPRRVGFIGRLSHEKAPDQFCLLAARCGEIAEFHLWGDGPMRVELEREHGHNVRFHGLVTDLADAWASLGLLVMPSRAEGLPMAALEALSAGVPILASDVGGLPRAVLPRAIAGDGATGWLAPAEDIETAARAVREWSELSVAQQSTLRRACVDHARSTFSEKAGVAQLLARYEAAGFKRQLAAIQAT